MGRLWQKAHPGELALRDRTTTVRFRLPDGAPPLPENLQGALAGDGAYSLATDSPTHSLHELTSWAVEHDIELEELTVAHPTLEDLFIELVGETGGSGE